MIQMKIQCSIWIRNKEIHLSMCVNIETEESSQRPKDCLYLCKNEKLYVRSITVITIFYDFFCSSSIMHISIFDLFTISFTICNGNSTTDSMCVMWDKPVCLCMIKVSIFVFMRWKQNRRQQQKKKNKQSTMFTIQRFSKISIRRCEEFFNRIAKIPIILEIINF